MVRTRDVPHCWYSKPWGKCWEALQKAFSTIQQKSFAVLSCCFFFLSTFITFVFHPLLCHGCYPLCLYVHPMSDNRNDIHLGLNAFTLIYYFESCCLHHSLGLDCILLSPACSRSAYCFMMKVARQYRRCLQLKFIETK